MRDSGLAKDGSAIIDGKVVRKGGVDVLHALFRQKKPVTVPELSKALKGVSDATLYSTLKRLQENQGLVVRKETDTVVFGTSLRHVTWKPTEATTKFFESLEEK